MQLTEPLPPLSPSIQQTVQLFNAGDSSGIDALIKEASVPPCISRIEGGAVLGQIVRSRRHTNADHLFIADVDVGEKHPRQIVYGGVRELQKGDFVPVALPGTKLLDKKEKLRKRNWRRQKSHGMLCSWEELGRDHVSTPAGNQVAVFHSSKVHLQPGMSLDGIVLRTDNTLRRDRSLEAPWQQ